MTPNVRTVASPRRASTPAEPRITILRRPRPGCVEPGPFCDLSPGGRGTSPTLTFGLGDLPPGRPKGETATSNSTTTATASVKALFHRAGTRLRAKPTPVWTITSGIFYGDRARVSGDPGTGSYHRHRRIHWEHACRVFACALSVHPGSWYRSVHRLLSTVDQDDATSTPTATHDNSLAGRLRLDIGEAHASGAQEVQLRGVFPLNQSSWV